MNGWLLEQEIDLSQPISRQYTSPYGIALTGDDRAQRLRYTVYDGQDAADLAGTVKVYYRRPDDTLIESTSGGDYVTVAGNIVTAELPPEAYEQKGTVECLVKLYASDGKIVTLARCDIEVRRGVENDETIIPAGEASRASLEDRVAALEVATGVVPIDQLPALPHNPQTGDYLEVEDGNGPYKIDYVALADAIIARSAALKKDFSILPIAPNPYTGTELIPLYRGGVNYRTDMTTLLQSAGGGGGTQQSALVNYHASYQLSAGTINTTFTDSNLTANMIIVQWYTSDDVTLSLTPTIADGSLTLAGTVSAATTITIYFGVGLTAAPTLLVNLASNSTDNILKTNPRPGVYGSLKVANGGTGADSAAGARSNLGVYSTSEVDDAISQSTASIEYYELLIFSGTSEATVSFGRTASDYDLVNFILLDSNGVRVAAAMTTVIQAHNVTFKLYGESSSQWGSIRISDDYTKATCNRTSSNTSQLRVIGIKYR